LYGCNSTHRALLLAVCSCKCIFLSDTYLYFHPIYIMLIIYVTITEPLVLNILLIRITVAMYYIYKPTNQVCEYIPKYVHRLITLDCINGLIDRWTDR